MGAELLPLIEKTGVLLEHFSPGLITEVEQNMSAAAQRALGVAERAHANAFGEAALSNKNAILGSLRTYAGDLTEAAPQVSESGKLRYTLVGSIGNSLSTTAPKLELLDTSALPEIKVLGTLSPSSKALEHGLGFTRKPGDIDLAIEPSLIGKLWNEGPRVGEMKMFRPDSEGGFDFRGLHRGDGIGAISENGRRIFVNAPDTGLAYKIAQGIHNTSMSSPESYVSDVEKLIGAAEQSYSRDHLARLAAERTFGPWHLIGWKPQFPTLELRHIAHRESWRDQSEVYRSFIDDAIKSHPNSKYIEGLPGMKNLGPNYLAAFSPLQTPEAKRELANFLATKIGSVKGGYGQLFKDLNKIDVFDPAADLAKLSSSWNTKA